MKTVRLISVMMVLLLLALPVFANGQTETTSAKVEEKVMTHDEMVVGVALGFDVVSHEEVVGDTAEVVEEWDDVVFHACLATLVAVCGGKVAEEDGVVATLVEGVGKHRHVEK